MMQKGIRPGTEMRCELLKTCSERNTPWSIRRQITEPMRGKTEQEKEQMASQILNDFRAGKLEL